MTSIGHIVAAAVPIMRAHAESLMLDRCRIDRAASSFDEAQQKTVTTWASVHVNVPCMVDDEPAPARLLVTDQAASPDGPDLYVPVAVTGIKPDDRVTITAIGPETDPALLGAVLWVTSDDTQSHAVERHLTCRRVR